MSVRMGVVMENKIETPYHIVMVIIGMYLNQSKSFITPRILQNELLKSSEFGYRLPFKTCEESLELLEIAGFIQKNGSEVIAGTHYPLYIRC